MTKRLDLPPIIRPIDGGLCEVPMQSIGICDESRKQQLRSTRLGGVTASPVAAAELESDSKQALDRRLDHALEETFPASDPISIICD